MVKRLNSDLLLFFPFSERQKKKLCTSTFTVQVSVWGEKKTNKQKKIRVDKWVVLKQEKKKKHFCLYCVHF